MKELTLTRFLDTGKETLGYLECEDLLFYLWTLELSWKENERRKSCIPCPKNFYLVRNHRSPNHGECFRLDYVKDRLNILIHKGNTIKDTKGCIIVGMSLGNIKGKPAVLQSTEALQLLRSIFKTDFKLNIIDKTK